MKVLHSFKITSPPRIIAELGGLKDSLPEGSILYSEESALRWRVVARVLYHHVGDAHQLLEGEAHEWTSLSFASLGKREESKQRLLKMEAEGVRVYHLEAVGHESKPEEGGELVELDGQFDNNYPKARASIICFLFVIFTFVSCEGIIGGDGTVIDSRTKMPIPGVTVELFIDGEIHEVRTSNQRGAFVGSQFVGCVPDCPSATLRFAKNGYMTKTMDFDTFWQNNPNQRLSNLTIELRQQ